VSNVLVVSNPKNWPLHIPGVEVVKARDYLTDSAWAGGKHTVFNCCRSYGYQTEGYYVSLLAAARGHRPFPEIATIQGMRSTGILRMAEDHLDELIARSLKRISSSKFSFNIYFGRQAAKSHEALAKALFNAFPAPFLRASFEYDDEEEEWELTQLRPIPVNEIPDADRPFVVEAAQAFFTTGQQTRARRRNYRYEMSILLDEDDKGAPSDEGAIELFEEAAKRLDIRPTRISRDDVARLGSFDAMFIRTTTAVNHYTFRFAQQAQADGQVVIDDPESIIRCTNKVYLAEMLARHKLPTPCTLVVDEEHRREVPRTIGFPCVLKKPDSSLSQGVFRADDQQQLDGLLDQLLDESDLVIAQAWTPTDFDWRIGVLDGRALYACRYHMAKDHWQIVRHDDGKKVQGVHETVAISAVPAQVLRTALAACRPIGDGLYGVDLKVHNSKVQVIEVNDNPSIESGVEDQLLGEQLYDRIMQVFLQRIDWRKAPRSRP
jgi:glutathione synthase/RimK-type ligase-like ATP-grasp enzyme